MTEDQDRTFFEHAVFNDYFARGIKRNPNPPRGTGALDFVPTNTLHQAELCERDGESYKDEAIGAMWHGWKLRRDQRGLIERLRDHLTGAKDHEIAVAINDLRDIAIKYHGAEQLRERIAERVLRFVEVWK